jgi:hypothetical protein
MKTSEICARGLFPVLVLVVAVTASCFAFRRAPAPKPAAVHPYIGRDLPSLFIIAARPENQPRRTKVVQFSSPSFVQCNTNPVTFVASSGSNNAVTFRDVLFKPAKDTL